MPNRNVLLIEDDSAIQEDLENFLTMEGYNVTVAKNGQEGLDKMISMDPPCLILLDLMMPVLNGWEFLAKKAELKPNYQYPVLIMSAMSDQVKDVDVIGYVKKPFELDKLMSYISQNCC